MNSQKSNPEHPGISGRRLVAIVIVFCAVVVAGMVLFRAITGAQRAAIKSDSLRSINYVKHKLLIYREVYGHFPPPYSVDADGKPLLSWRVHLLPLMEQQQLYDKFDLSEPWDSPTNRPLIAEMPDVYALGDRQSLQLGHTAIFGVVGENSLFRLDPPVTRNDVTDGEDSIALVEATGSGIAWTRPIDLEFDAMSFIPNDPRQPSLRSPRWREPIVVSLNGNPRELPKPMNPDELKRLLTIDAGD